jgi:hypothetical protein
VWNEIGNKLIAMARDFPEDQYDFNAEGPAQLCRESSARGRSGLRPDALGLGSNLGPDFGKNKHNPRRDVYQTKADVVKLIEQAIVDRARPGSRQERAEAFNV